MAPLPEHVLDAAVAARVDAPAVEAVEVGEALRARLLHQGGHGAVDGGPVVVLGGGQVGEQLASPPAGAAGGAEPVVAGEGGQEAVDAARLGVEEVEGVEVAELAVVDHRGHSTRAHGAAPDPSTNAPAARRWRAPHTSCGCSHIEPTKEGSL
jgi:hypothetical protein